MSDALIAITEELRRLQQEGVDRVFVEDATLDLLPSAAPAKPAPKQPNRPESAAPAGGVISELANLVEGGAPQKKKEPPAPSTNSGTKTPGKPLPKEPAQFELPDGEPATQLAWLQDRVENCPICNEHLSDRGKVVFGTGSVHADIFFCGEAPGADEEIQGEPFVGKAGQLLTKIIGAMGLKRDDVYIANILKWRPEHDKPSGNRPPTIEEMNFCLPYVKAQIEIVKPKVIVALGNTAVTGLLGPDPNRRMGSIRGTWQTFAGIPLMITFHPSYLLRAETQSNPNAKKRMVWEDMLQVMEKAGLPISEKQRGFFLPKSQK
jgi:DNA polymerase